MDKSFMSSEIKYNGIWLTPAEYRGRKRTDQLKQLAFSLGLVALVAVLMVLTFLAFGWFIGGVIVFVAVVAGGLWTSRRSR